MDGFNKLLVAVDFSEPSIRALRVAVTLCSEIDAELRVIYVANMDDPGLSKEDGDDKGATESKLLNSFQGELEQLTNSMAATRVSTITEVIFGEPVDAINSAVESSEIDMIIIGTHGRTGLDHLLMGSVAESVLQSAKVPVMCIRN